MRRVLWLASTLLTLTLLALVAVALMLTGHSVEIDATPFKERIAGVLRERTGLEFGVEGELHLRVGPRLGLWAQGLKARNHARPEAGDLLAAEAVELEVETLPVLYGRFEPVLLQLTGAKVRLDRDGEGRWNWQVAGKEPSSSDEVAPDVGFLFPDRMHANIRGSRLTYSDRRSATSFEAELKTADFEPTAKGMRVDLDGSVNGHPLRLKGVTATPSRLIEGASPLPVDLQGNLLGLHLTASGTVADPWSGAQVAAALRIEGKSLAGLRPWVGDAVAGHGPVRASLDVRGGGSTYRFAPFELQVGEGRFDGSLEIDLSGNRPRLNLDLTIEEVDLTPLFNAIGSASAGDATGKRAGAAGLFADEPLSVAWTDAVEGQARIRLRNLVTPYTIMRDIDMEASLTARRLSVKAKGRDRGGRADSLNFLLDAGVQPIAMSVGYKGDKVLLERLLQATNARDMIRGEADISADFKGSGNSGRQLARSLDGRLLFRVTQVEADLRQLDRLTPGVRNLFGQLVTRKGQLAKVNCGVAAFDVQGGKTKVSALLDTPASTVVAHGHLDLGSETLNVRVVPDAKGVNLKVSAPVVIRGSLANPTYAVEKGAVLVSLTDVASKIAVPHLLLVDAFGDAVADNTCVKIASGDVEARQMGPLDAVTHPVETVVKGTGALVKGAGGAVVKGTGALLKGVGGAVGGLLGGGRREGALRPDPNRKQEGGGQFLDE